MKCVSYLRTLIIIIRYKKVSTYKWADMLSRPSVNALLVALGIHPLIPTEYAKSYTSTIDFTKVFEQAKGGRKSEFELLEYFLYKGILL